MVSKHVAASMRSASAEVGPLARSRRPSLSLCLVLLLTPVASAGNWPGWRGDGSGISKESDLPAYWSVEANIRWRAELPGEGNSSPIVWDDAVFVTASLEAGKKRVIIRLDAATGAIVWQREFMIDTVAPTYPKTGYAASTPVTDGKRVYAFFDAPGLVAVGLDGKPLWTLPLGPFKSSYNMASSPVLCDDLVVLNCDHDKESFIVGVDAATGKIRWRTPRKMGRQYATPLVITHDGKKQIVMAGRTIVAYAPSTGKQLWSCRGMKPVVSPSPIHADGLVYVASGRNGPAVAIDPGGRGDVTETHVRMHIATGGPYVPSPLLHRGYLLLPGDNGMLRFVNADGEVALEQRLPGHYTSSPVLADDKLYWTNEKGDTYVVGLVKAGGDAPQADVVAISRLGEQCLASPAIANGRLLIRTSKRLFCISGKDKGVKPVISKAARGSFAELKKRYESHPAAEGPHVAVRIEVVEALAGVDAREAIALLEHAARKDPHWDVSEAAVKALGAHGEAAVPALLAMFQEWRPYLKIVAAQHLARLQSADALPTLLKGAKDRDQIVRLSCLRAIGQIAEAREADMGKVTPALVAGLKDKEGVVREAAIEALALVVDKVGAEREAIVQALLDRAADRSPIVARSAKQALQEAFRAPAEVVSRDEVLYGEQRKRPVVAMLAAGPMRMKFHDGELRYIYVGDKEIVRRIYFAVRDSRWDTVMPELDDIKIQKQKDGFRVSMRARCKNDVADYRWTGEITGKPEGSVTFRVNGQAMMDFRSPRVGLNVLYGADSLAGQSLEAVGADGKVVPGEFPKLVSPALITGRFQTIRFKMPSGAEVTAGLTEGEFGMEDQRNFCDSSYKAFSGIAHKYPNVKQGDKGGQTFVLGVKGAAATPPAEGLVRVRLGEPLQDAKMPKLTAAEDPQKRTSFGSVNRRRKKLSDAEAISWSFNPAAHMPDDDTFMENLSAVLDQVRTVKSFAPGAKIRIAPVSIDSPYPRPARDPRNKALFGAAWLAGVVRYMAVAGVDEAAFAVGPGYADLVREDMAKFAGDGVVSVEVRGLWPLAVEALAIQHKGDRVIWLINKTDTSQEAVVEGLGGATQVHAQRIDERTVGQSSMPERILDVKGGSLSLTLSAYEVCRIRVPAR